MDAINDELKALLEREKIRECIVRLARGEDRRAADIISAGHYSGRAVGDHSEGFFDKKSSAK